MTTAATPVAKAATVKKSSTTAEAVYGSASKKLSNAVRDLLAATSQLSTISEKSEDLSDLIANKEERIKALDVEYSEKRRAHDVEFDLKVKENSLKVAEEILASQHLVSVPKQELENLRQEFTSLQTSFDDRVKAETGKLTGILKSQFEGDKKLLEAQFNTKEAENIASIKSLTAQVASLEAAVETWKVQLNSERTASVDRAKASQVGAINIGGPSNGR